MEYLYRLRGIAQSVQRQGVYGDAGSLGRKGASSDGGANGSDGNASGKTFVDYLCRELFLSDLIDGEEENLQQTEAVRLIEAFRRDFKNGIVLGWSGRLS